MAPHASGAVRRQPAAGRAPRALPGVDLRLAGGALVLRFGTPGPGAWSGAFAGSVAALLAQCRADARAGRVVLTGARLFAEAGAEAADLSAVLEALAGPGHPVVAAVPGDAAGLGLELALGCHAIVAAPGGVFALPGILRGALPVNGGVAGLARRLAPEAALEMLAFGTAVPAAVAARLGLADAVAADPVAAAGGVAPPARAGARAFDPRALEALVRRRAPGEAAPLAALHVLVQALTLPALRARAEGRAAAAVLAGSVQGIALRHAAAAEAGGGGDAEALSALRWALLREAIHLVDEGAAPQAVDLALRRFGFREGPLAAADRDGLDLVAQACVDREPQAWRRYSPLLDLLLDAGRTGRAAGAGWYRYAPGDPTPLPDPALGALLAESARAGCRRRRAVAEAEIVARGVAAMAGGAAGLIARGVAPLAVDALSLGLGFPRWRGGIWHHVAAVGRAGIAATLAGMATAWPPAPPLLG